MTVLLGAIADDFTGATDLCNTLVRNGMRAVQLIDPPPADMAAPDADAIVIALKSRTCPVAEAVELSLRSLTWLREHGARQILFKYCSTFDSTETGNIGPVADALLDALGTGFTIACPAFPETGRTVYRGHLFVGDALLSDTHMRSHPLTPMTDSNLVRVLGHQTRRKVGLVPYAAVDQGVAAVKDAFASLRDAGASYAITDVLADRHLLVLGEAVADLPLVTGGSGIAMGLPENFRCSGLMAATREAAVLPKVTGHAAVLSGSCSAATLAQVAAMAQRWPALKLAPAELGDPSSVAQAAAWARRHLSDGPVLIYASAPPEEVKAIQERLGREVAGQRIEAALATIARRLVEDGVRRLVVAGGETSGAVVKALGITGLRIGEQIDPGVPCCVTLDEPTLAIALKSGNFGAPDFFTKALERMP